MSIFNVDNKAKFAKEHGIEYYHVRDLLAMEEPELWDAHGLDDVVMIQFDDDESEIVPFVDVILSWYFWQIVYYYEEVQIDKTHFIRGERFTDDDFRTMLEKSILNTRGVVDKEEKERVWRLAYKECYNKLFNAISTRMCAFISSTDSTHVQQIIDDPDIRKANESVDIRFSTVLRAHKTLMEVMDSNRYPDNPIIQSYFNRTVKAAQSKQSYSARGGITDIDSVLYKRHIPRGYAMGFRTINDFVKESRAAAKALLYNKDPVAMAEYFSRKMQLVCSVIERIVEGDCGTQHFHEWKLDVNDHKLLSAMNGCMQILDDGTLREIDGKDTSLLGTTVRFRTALCCRHAENQEICETCFGGAAYSMPHDTNVGHVCCTANNKEFTQNIISTKHLDFIIKIFKAVLRGQMSSWFSTSEKEDEASFIYYNKTRVGEKNVIAIHKDYLPGIARINYVSDIRAISDLEAVSSIQTMKVFRKDSMGVITQSVAELSLVMDSVSPSFTYDFLEHIKTQTWYEDSNHYFIDISDWTDSKPMFIYPLKHENMSVFSRRFEHFMRGAISDTDDNESEVKLTSSEKTSLTSLQKYTDVDSALFDTFTFVSSKLGRAQISHLAVLLLATRVADAEGGDWRPSNMGTGSFQPHDNIIRYRSLGPNGIYERQYQIVKDLKSFTLRKRPPSIVDPAVYIEPPRQ